MPVGSSAASSVFDEGWATDYGKYLSGDLDEGSYLAKQKALASSPFPQLAAHVCVRFPLRGVGPTVSTATGLYEAYLRDLAAQLQQAGGFEPEPPDYVTRFRDALLSHDIAAETGLAARQMAPMPVDLVAIATSYLNENHTYPAVRAALERARRGALTRCEHIALTQRLLFNALEMPVDPRALVEAISKLAAECLGMTYAEPDGQTSHVRLAREANRADDEQVEEARAWLAKVDRIFFAGHAGQLNDLIQASSGHRARSTHRGGEDSRGPSHDEVRTPFEGSAQGAVSATDASPGSLSNEEAMAGTAEGSPDASSQGATASQAPSPGVSRSEMSTDIDEVLLAETAADLKLGVDTVADVRKYLLGDKSVLHEPARRDPKTGLQMPGRHARAAVIMRAVMEYTNRRYPETERTRDGTKKES